MNLAGALSLQFRTAIENDLGAITSNIMRVSKYSDQILLSVLRAGPSDLLDEYFPLTQIVHAPRHALSAAKTRVPPQRPRRHREPTPAFPPRKKYPPYQSDIKSLIFDLGLLEQAKPMMLAWTLPKLYEILFYTLINHTQFNKNTTLRYALIGIRRIIKEFSYYCEEQQFALSLRQKHPAANTIPLRQICHSFYLTSFTEPVITNLLNFLLQTPYARSAADGWTEGEEVERGQEKEAGL